MTSAANRRWIDSLPECVHFSETIFHAVVPGQVVVVEHQGPCVAGCRERAMSDQCAAAAMAISGCLPLRPERDKDGVPMWPAGATGSMTHRPNLQAAAFSTELRSLGIDVEEASALVDTARARVVSESEQLEHAELDLPAYWDRVIFSAKESAYKAWFPMSRVWMDPLEIQVHLDPDGTLSAERWGAALHAWTVQGRWASSDGHIATAAWVD